MQYIHTVTAHTHTHITTDHKYKDAYKHAYMHANKHTQKHAHMKHL